MHSTKARNSNANIGFEVLKTEQIEEWGRTLLGRGKATMVKDANMGLGINIGDLQNT